MDLLVSKSNNNEGQGEQGKKKTFRRSSQKLMRKLQKITFNTISSNSNESKASSNNNDEQENQTILTIPNTVNTSQSSLESTEERKLKSILKTPSKDKLFVYENTNQSIESIDRQETCQTESELNSPKRIKHVRFNENISKKKYQNHTPISSLLKLSRRQRKKLKELERKDSLEVLPTNGAEPSKCDPLNDSESSESSDDDD